MAEVLMWLRDVAKILDELDHIVYMAVAIGHLLHIGAHSKIWTLLRRVFVAVAKLFRQ